MSNVQKYLVVGTPISQTLSPQLHNAVYRELGLPRELAAVDPGDEKGFKVLLQDLRAGKYQGFCVTIPYKLAAAQTCKYTSPAVQRTGAANYIRRDDDGTLSADNTDVVGFLRSLELKLGLKPAGLNVCICGSGGAARAICDALLTHGVSQVTVVTRNPSVVFGAAGTDGSAHSVRVVSYDTLHQMDCSFDLLVNATSLGMKDELMPVTQDWTHSSVKAVFDAVYRKSGTTPLVQMARSARIPATDGRAMLIEQAVAGMRFWDVREDPAQLRSIMEAALPQMSP